MNLYGLDSTYENSAVIVIPVPWEGTVSYGGGTSAAPEAILKASPQIDLCDPELGQVHKQGIFMLEIPSGDNAWATYGRGGGHDNSTDRVELVNQLSVQLNEHVYAVTQKVINDGKTPIVLGGEHSVSYGAIKAMAEGRFSNDKSAENKSGDDKSPQSGSFGILHLDAHFDLRNAYEGFVFSHASAMYNVLQNIPQVSKLVSVGARDFCEEELELASTNEKIKFVLDNDLAMAKIKGESWFNITERIINELPDNVWVSFDIDALDPSLAPHTGTPVPGGLSFHEADYLLRRIVKTGHNIVGADLCEVAPGENSEWDANVGMRVLYKLFGWICHGKQYETVLPKID